MADSPQQLPVIPWSAASAAAAVHRWGLLFSSHYPHRQNCCSLLAAYGSQLQHQGHRSRESRSIGVSSSNCNILARCPYQLS